MSSFSCLASGIYSYMASSMFSHSRHLQAAPHFLPELWHQQYFFRQWLFWHLHLVTPLSLFVRKSRSLFRQATHSQSEEQATPILKHQQQFFRHPVLEQKHRRTTVSVSAQVEADLLDTFRSANSGGSKWGVRTGAGLQSQLNDGCLVMTGSATSRAIRSWSSSLSSRPSMRIMICSSSKTWSCSSMSMGELIQNKYTTKRKNADFRSTIDLALFSWLLVGFPGFNQYFRKDPDLLIQQKEHRP